jgi:hypothetical protein
MDPKDVSHLDYVPQQQRREQATSGAVDQSVMGFAVLFFVVTR